jgi:hypothetical protein
VCESINFKIIEFIEMIGVTFVIDDGSFMINFNFNWLFLWCVMVGMVFEIVLRLSCIWMEARNRKTGFYSRV